MNWVWFALIAVSVVVGAVTGRIGDVSKACLTGATDAVELFLVLLATICLWSGLMKIADESGVTAALQKALSPITKRIFRDLKPNGAAMKAISMNIAANLMGLGNAATPLGLKAMQEMHAHTSEKKTATDSMILFVVINTASIQIVPSTIAVLRIKYGSKAPFEIVPSIWLASVVTLTAGILITKLLSAVTKHHTENRQNSTKQR